MPAHDDHAQNVMRERFEQIGGARIRLREGGRGEAVVLLPGWPQSIHCWRKVVPLLAPHYSLIAVDPPGLGLSDLLPAGSDTRAVADAIAALLGRLGHGRVLVVGHDIGTWIGYVLAARYPQLVRRLVVIDALVPGLAPPQGYAFAPERVLKNWHFFFNVLPDLPEMLIAGREREYLSWLFATRSADFAATFTQADIEEYVRCYARPGAMAAGLSYYRAIFTDMAQNQELAREKLAMPVLAVGGERWLGAAMAPMFAAIANDVTGAVIPGCAHFVPEEAPARLAELILEFFARGG